MNFFLVTPRDFARSIAWSRRQPPNPIATALKQHSMTATTEMKVIARARFFSGGIAAYMPASSSEGEPVNRPHSVITSAEVEYKGVRLFSAVPKSAAEAEKINNAIGA